MATYCFRCPECNERFQVSSRDTRECSQGHEMVRDYQAENVGVQVAALKTEREEGKEGLKRLFLPHNDDFKGPGDPDGTAGMRQWRETHQPKAGNKNPAWPGHVDKKVW